MCVCVYVCVCVCVCHGVSRCVSEGVAACIYIYMCRGPCHPVKNLTKCIVSSNTSLTKHKDTPEKPTSEAGHGRRSRAPPTQRTQSTVDGPTGPHSAPLTLYVYYTVQASRLVQQGSCCRKPSPPTAISHTNVLQSNATRDRDT